MGGWLDRYRAWQWRRSKRPSTYAEALAELDRRRNPAPKPFCDCPYDDDLGARLHEEGCPVAKWYDDEAKRRRDHGL